VSKVEPSFDSLQKTYDRPTSIISIDIQGDKISRYAKYVIVEYLDMVTGENVTHKNRFGEEVSTWALTKLLLVVLLPTVN